MGVEIMKIKQLTILALSSLILGACQQGSATPEEEMEQQDNNSTEVEPEETAPEEDLEDKIIEDEIVEFQYQINPKLYSVEPIQPDANADEKLVLLTYDDAPYGNTLEIAEALSERGVSAIFFVNGFRITNFYLVVFTVQIIYASYSWLGFYAPHFDDTTFVDIIGHQEVNIFAL